MKNPYKIESPAKIAFSGGRTSGYMLWNILKAYEYKFPEDIYVCFYNTGKEDEQTLQFVKDIGENWQIKIYWIELDIDLTKTPSPSRKDDLKWKEVTFETASRNGEPFKNIIDYMRIRRFTYPENYSERSQQEAREGRGLLPNVLSRYCTDVMKVEAGKNFMKKRDIKIYNDVIGLRYDEPRRVSNIKKRSTRKVEMLTPLDNAKVTKEEVAKFWSDHWFDLDLPNDGIHSNCDLCFLKGRKKVETLIREKPEIADWWIEREEENKTVFRKDRFSYKQVKDEILSQPSLFTDETDDGDLGDCFCTD